MYDFLWDKHNSRISFDPTYPGIKKSSFRECEWKDLYGDCEEAIQSNAPKSREKDVDLKLYVDIDHDGEKITRRSRSGFFFYMNTALIQWFLKKQSTIETYVFGADFLR